MKQKHNKTNTTINIKTKYKTWGNCTHARTSIHADIRAQTRYVETKRTHKRIHVLALREDTIIEITETPGFLCVTVIRIRSR